MSGYTISEVSKLVGLPAKTIRYYEESGVIKPIGRELNSYRQFSQRDIDRLVLVRRARSLGIPLSEVKNIVSECIEKGCGEARQYIASKLLDYIKQTEQKLEELQSLKEQLLYIQNRYTSATDEWQHRTETCCEIIPVKEPAK